MVVGPEKTTREEKTHDDGGREGGEGGGGVGFGWMKPIICLDFDGVIHMHLSGWRGPAVIPDPPVPGAREAIQSLREVFLVVVFSGRCASEEGRAAVQRWLEFYKIEVDGVSEHKPVASVYVDDRAVQFKGNWEQTIKDVQSFRHWQPQWKDTRFRRRMV